MEVLLIVLGIFTSLFFLLALTNVLKSKVKHKSIIWISSNHKLFGMLASITAVAHLVIAIVIEQLRITGLLALIALLLTGLFGMLFSKLKKKELYIAHRIMGPITFTLILIHVITNLL